MSRWSGFLFILFTGVACGPQASDAGENGDDEAGGLAEVCAGGCDYLLACAPTQFGNLYADLGACQDYCTSTYAACVPEAEVYVDCFMGLECSEVVVLVSESPQGTACGPAFAELSEGCPP